MPLSIRVYIYRLYFLVSAVHDFRSHPCSNFVSGRTRRLDSLPSPDCPLRFSFDNHRSRVTRVLIVRNWYSVIRLLISFLLFVSQAADNFPSSLNVSWYFEKRVDCSKIVDKRSLIDCVEAIVWNCRRWKMWKTGRVNFEMWKTRQ